MIGYNGPLCASCEAPLYGKGDGFQCASCNSSLYLVKKILQLLIKTLLLYLSTWKAMEMNTDLSKKKRDFSRDFCDKISSSYLLKLLIQHLQIIMIIKSLPLDIPDVFDDILSFVNYAGPEFYSAFSWECVYSEGGYNWNLTYFTLAAIFSFIGFSVLVLLSVFSLRNKLAHSISKRKRRATLYKSLHMYWKPLVLIFLIISIISPVEALLNSLFCIDISDEKNSKSDFRALRELSFNCYTNDHLFMIFFCILPLIILIAVILPCYIAFRIVKAKNKDYLDNAKFLAKFGYFYFPYRKKACFFELLVTWRKIGLCLIQIFFLYSLIKQMFESGLLILFFFLLLWFRFGLCCLLLGLVWLEACLWCADKKRLVTPFCWLLSRAAL